ncbi:hypothetical protein ASPSYDRAFT_92004 [Aspergillus sydowii CBS 593.65]|uniref:MADS-box domain-containing protein n=1 Tax=Aspergillus sydowii CBS 593.65 TaxID=1036612 RepID=A0A1L9TBF1_9EURO|nr:uncharacterized protein ASPSYDRAFT_92004 [Aspergillus sydowii CBS 593.65]OJJ56758.1 hypothetical protein ASPSYDRAFT_92004 [Aspergillus sydowii CBS 593.65]
MASEISLPENKKNRYRSRKAFRQMRDRRREGIIKKANEYSKLCSADVCLGIRLRDSGRVYTFLADESGFWSSFESQVVAKTFPTPIRRTTEDFAPSHGTQHGSRESDTSNDNIGPT